MALLFHLDGFHFQAFRLRSFLLFTGGLLFGCLFLGKTLLFSGGSYFGKTLFVTLHFQESFLTGQ